MIRFESFTRAEIAGGCGVALPMISGDVKAALRGRSDGIVVIMQGARPGTEPEEAVLLCIHAKDAEKTPSKSCYQGGIHMPTEVIRLTLPEDELRSSVGFLHQMSVQDTYPLHTHDFYEFFYVLGGRAIHDINGEKRLLTQGTLVLIRPEDVHRYHFISNHDMELLSCGVTRELIEKACGYMNLSEDAFLRLPAPPQIIYSESMHWYMSQRLLAIGKHAPGDARRQYFLSILPDLLQQMITAPENANGQLPPWISRLVLKMSKPENFIEGLPRMVALSGVSQEHLNRAFKRYLGITPTAFINMKRINHAAELLRQGKPVLEACMASGFNHVSYFYQVFEKTYHCTPKQFSKAQQAEGDQRDSE